MRTEWFVKVLRLASGSRKPRRIQAAATRLEACWRRITAVLLLAGVLVSPAARADADPGTTERVSLSSAGTQGNGLSVDASISADGRFVAFASDASNLVPGGSNGFTHVYVHDRQTGTTERVSVDSAGTQGNGSSFFPALSADGRFVAFQSQASASNLVPGDTNSANDVFVHDRGIQAEAEEVEEDDDD